jgi:hypothetical protein
MNMKKYTWFGICGVAIAMLACSFITVTTAPPTPADPATDEVGSVVTETMRAFTPTPGENTATPALTQAGGAPISFENVSFLIPNGLAGGSDTEKMTAVDTNSGAPWDVAPTHLRFTLTGYELQDKFHEPRIFVYPAEEYTQRNPAAAEQIERLQKILMGSALLKETLPIVPFFNATPQLAAQIKILTFQNGGGVRALTQYAQYSAPINNRELFYHFQGLTRDGRHYLIAILPITAPILAEDEKPDAPVPAEGVPIPTDIGPNEVYYISVTEKLNSLSPNGYTPSLETLDALIQSILVN